VLDDRMGLLIETAEAVARALRGITDRGPSGHRVGQYALDVVADEAALVVLHRAGVGVLSEESGLVLTAADEVVIIDPVDGSTNASRGVPWYATSLCLVDADGPAAALVVNQATGVRYWAERDAGAWCDGVQLTPSGCTDVGSSIIGLNGLPPAHLGYAQSRVFGAVALDLCQVAAGVLDGYIDCIVDAHGAWDFAGGTLICAEAGAPVVDLWDRDLFTVTHESRRTPVAAATPELLATLVDARRGMGSGGAGA
jgi:myo-inositol-1(or 4)-monophosphatase